MNDPRFDPSRALTFDLAQGIVLLEGAPPRVVVPGEALAKLCEAAGRAAAEAFGRVVGDSMGRRIAARFAGEAAGADSAGAVRGATTERVVEHLGGELALAGLGQLSLERWGRALVAVVDHSPLGANGDPLLATILAAALASCTGRDVRAGLLGRDEARARFLVSSESALARLRALLDGGVSWGEALVKLHAGADGPARGDA